MGGNGSYFTIWVMIIHLLSSSFVLSFHSHLLHDPIALDSYLHNHTFSSIPKGKLGVLHKVHFPSSNLSGIEVSIVRMKSIVIWTQGARFEPLFNIPPRILTSSFVITIDIMYENLGNLSSYFYKLPHYSFLAPVIGLTFYDTVVNRKANVTVLGKPITINFTTIFSPKLEMTHEAKCVRFDLNGQVEMSKMISPNVCTSRNQGHFSIVSPVVHSSPSQPSTPTSSKHHRRRRFQLWYWWVIGFGSGLFGIVLITLVLMVVCRSCMLKKIKWMEKKSEKSVVLDTRWIRDSRLPCASMTRTQPSIENDFVP